MPRFRLLKKFVEHDYQHVDRLIEMMEAGEARLKSVNREIELEQHVSRAPLIPYSRTLSADAPLQGMQANNEEITEVETDEWYMRRMNAGLAFLQDICYCLAWLIMEDDGVSLGRQLALK